jgi:hypothetical protein
LRRAAPAVRARGGFRKRLATPAVLMAALLASWFVFYAAGTALEMSSAPPTKVVK